jgi:hypothetical protein
MALRLRERRRVSRLLQNCCDNVILALVNWHRVFRERTSFSAKDVYRKIISGSDKKGKDNK